MKKKRKKQTQQQEKKVTEAAPTKGALETLSNYFDSYLSALEVVNSRN